MRAVCTVCVGVQGLGGLGHVRAIKLCKNEEFGSKVPFLDHGELESGGCCLWNIKLNESSITDKKNLFWKLVY